MIKINYNGFSIEVDSVEDAQKLIHRTARNENVPVISQLLTRRRKHHHRMMWTDEEIRTVFSSIDNLLTTDSISSNRVLRETQQVCYQTDGG